MPNRGATRPPTPVGDVKPRLLVFYSGTSGQCRRVDSYLAQVLQRRRNHDTFEVVRVRVDEEPGAVERLAIEVLPTLLVVEQGAVRARLEGPRGRAEIETALAPWLRTGIER